ncbi:MAG TPA: hypothetical protein VFM71_05015 [Gemmatimonadaceae bacterium]|nr:hypothetical protein [Gemmatimonadaceae bacterium]
MKILRARAPFYLALALFAGPTVLAAQAASPAVRVVIEESIRDSAGLVTLTVRFKATGVELGAYQGKLEFEPGAFDIVSATSPRGDGTRMVNAADSASGVVRFAGYGLPGFKDDMAMTLVVRPRGTMVAARVRAGLEVAGDVDGVPIAAESFIPAQGTTRTAP